jgi:hypothetical protein
MASISNRARCFGQGDERRRLWRINASPLKVVYGHDCGRSFIPVLEDVCANDPVEQFSCCIGGGLGFSRIAEDIF